MKLLKQSEILEASKILKEGGIIAFPTETVFGFGVIYDNKEAYQRLIDIKRRPPEKPFTLMCGSVEDIYKYAEVNDIAKKLIKAYMPGQFTIILKAKNNLPSFCISKEGNVGIRVPDYKMVQDLIREVGKPLLVPSANRSGEEPLHNSKDVNDKFSKELDAIILGESISDTPSTIVLVDEDVHIIREGLIKKEEVLKLIKEDK